MTSIQQDEDNMVDFDATAAFLEKWKDADEPSETSEGAEDDDEQPEAVDQSDNETEEEVDDDEEVLEDPDEEPEAKDTEEPQAAKVAEDDAEVVITVDGKEVKASVKDLKRLYGQEASLTRKNQELAETRKAVEAEQQTYTTALQTLQKKAEDKYRPYAQIDYMVASKQLDADEFEALRKEALTAYEDYKFFTEELKSTKEASDKKAHQTFVEQAQKAIETLSNPETGIPGWSQEIYNEIRTFAVEANGMEMEAVNKITDPAILKMMWQAMRYAKAKKVSTKKIAAAPKKVMKSTVPSATTPSKGKQDKAISKLRETGSRDAAVDALVARWADDED